MDFNIENIPIDLEGVNIPSLPGTSQAGELSLSRDDLGISEDEIRESGDESDDDRTRKNIIRRETSKLPLHLKGLMGEANLRYARGDIETSKKMCYEVIRQEPEAFEPYLTLAQMYETSNLKKYKGFLMLACSVAPNNVSIICRLADVFLQEGNFIEVIRCHSRAINADPTNVSIHKMRIEFLEQRSEMKKLTLIAKQTMANRIPIREHELILKVAMDVAKEHFEQKNYIRAVEALRIPLKRIPDNVTRDVINMILELLIILERYSECLDVFTEFCGITFDINITEDQSLHINSFNKPDNLHVDLKFKLYTCMIRLRAEHIFLPLIDQVLIQDDVETLGDLYLDVVEALICMSYHDQALKLLVSLVKSKTYSTAAVWLKYAECLASCQMVDQAIEAYFTVMALAPSHVEVLYPLAMLLLQQNKKKEALEVLSQDLSTNKLDVAVLIEKMKLLKQIHDWPNYWKSAELLLSRHCIIPKYEEDVKAICQFSSFSEKKAKVKKMRTIRNEPYDVESEFVSIKEPSIEEEYELYREILQIAKDRREYSIFQKLSFMGLASKRFQKYFSEIFLIAFISSILNKDFYIGYGLVREILLRHPKNNTSWNWLVTVTSNPEDLRHIRFLERNKSKFVQEDRLLALANNNIHNGNYTESMNYFIKHFKQTNSPFSALMLAVSMQQYYFQRKADSNKKKSLAETLTYLFINYSQLRTKNVKQEIYYNLGRMYQLLGVMYLAEFYYKEVFKVSNAYLEKYPHLLCLKREAAFNLHLIYKNSGNLNAAREVLYEHIVI